MNGLYFWAGTIFIFLIIPGLIYFILDLKKYKSKDYFIDHNNGRDQYPYTEDPMKYYEYRSDKIGDPFGSKEIENKDKVAIKNLLKK